MNRYNLHHIVSVALVTCTFVFPNVVTAQQSDVETGLTEILDDAEKLGPLETILVSVNGDIVAQRGYRGNSVSEPTNIKSASKSIISALVGIAIERGLIEGVDQSLVELLPEDLPDDPDSRLNEITVGNLLSMQAGLDPTSGRNYGRWVSSPNWVRFVLSQPFQDRPGERMLYSTGSSHLLSAILTRVGGRSTLALARDWLSAVEGFSIAGWEQDPQGVYLGGNQMAMSPLSLLSFGELYRKGGLASSEKRVISENWIEKSWEPKTESRHSGEDYGYGWFLRKVAGETVRYGWGYGGQMLYVVPTLGLTVVMTSDENSPSGSTGHRDDLHKLLGDIIEVVRPDVE